MLDLLPDRNADSVARWLKSWPGIKIVARDRAGLYADGARCGAPDAVQVADRWHLLNSLGDALRHAVGRHRRNLAAAVQIMAAAKTPITGVSAPAPGLAQLRADRRAARRERWDEICRLRAQGCPTSGIGKLLGVDRRTVQRWLAAGGEPDHSRPLDPRTFSRPSRHGLKRAGPQAAGSVSSFGGSFSSRVIPEAG